MEQRTDLLEIIKYISPSELDYQEWINVGMALKHEGYAVSDWDDWSRNDSRYHQGECKTKWDSFRGSSSPVTGGTIVQMAMEHGWRPSYDSGRELDWDDEISTDGLVVIDKSWVEEKEVREPRTWDPVNQIVQYLEVLFEASENVGYVMQSWEKDGRYIPANKGNYGRTAGKLIEMLSKCEGDIGSVLGDYNPKGGAWIRFNPLDGKDVKGTNVTDFKYALVESDELEIEQQNAIIRELELPVACLVHSGGKSLHAIVKVDAADYNEYRKRVDYLYSVCQKNGLKVDIQNKNPSRLSRMPGIERNGKKQFIVDRNIGKESWNEWKEWIEGINDDLPEPESLENVWEDLPELSPCLIDHVLRRGHKMLIAGPSKAGKSFLLIELCIAIAEGRKWINWECAGGKVLYVNLELDRASCLHRFKDVYQALSWKPEHLHNIDIWNLRGKSVPMDKLAPKLIRRAAKKDYIAVVIDPIYKVITGDENSADQMANFCNQFDKVCTELGCAVVYCHHHSKGSQGSKKSMDRASGSGVFARDPDALLDLIELETTDALLKQEENKAVCAACIKALKRFGYEKNMREDLSQDDECSSIQMIQYCGKILKRSEYNLLDQEIQKTCATVQQRTAWRIEWTLREFPKFQPVSLWFDYPIHLGDESGALKDIQPEDEKPAWERGAERRKKQAEKNRAKKLNRFELEFSNLELEGRKEISSKELAEKMEISSKELLSWFGDGVRQKKDLKKDYEKYMGENGMMCIRRRPDHECSQP